MSHLSREQERELLELQTILAKLKIEAARAKKKEAKHQEYAPSRTVMNFVNSASGLMGNKHWLKLAMLPGRWRYRLMVGALLLGWEWYCHSQKNQVYRHQKDDFRGESDSRNNKLRGQTGYKGIL